MEQDWPREKGIRLKAITANWGKGSEDSYLDLGRQPGIDEVNFWQPHEWKKGHDLGLDAASFYTYITQVHQD